MPSQPDDANTNQATEYERLNRALSIYRDTMRRHISDVLDDDPEDVDPTQDWYERKVIERLESEKLRETARLDHSRFELGSTDWRGESQLDIQHFLFAIKHNAGFRQLDCQDMFDLMAEIYTVRNRWAHPPLGGFRRSEVDRVVNQIVTVLELVDTDAAGEVAALSSRQMEFVATQETLHAIQLTHEAVEQLLARSINPDALSDIIRSATSGLQQFEQIDARLERMESDLTGEREARERQLGQIAETLALLVNAQHQATSQPKQSQASWIDELLDPNGWRQTWKSLRRSLRL